MQMSNVEYVKNFIKKIVIDSRNLVKMCFLLLDLLRQMYSC